MFQRIAITLLALTGTLDALKTTIKSPGGMFSVELHCKYIEKQCQKFKKTIELVNQFFENAFKVKKRINVKVQLVDCQDENGLADNVLASTAPNYSIPQYKVPDKYYPNALLKQTQGDNFGPLDFTVLINGNSKFYFPEDFATLQNGYSIIDTITHEFLHGMGFSVDFADGILNAAIAPRFETESVLDKKPDTITFQFNPFMQHIYTKDGIKMTKLIHEMNKENRVILKEGKVQLSDYHLEKVERFLKYANTPKGFYFKTSTNDHIYLDTSPPFIPGASLSHLDDMHKEDEEALMTKSRFKNTGAHDVDLKGWKTSPFGPKTLRIMETFGYTLNPNPHRKKSLLGFKDDMLACKKKLYIFCP
ncbi:hypothetical protein DSO57_1012187 [Entomophthora muscae]|uniref:Uncharacterized protein n=1 Tax=Entomophthora muscae TaxID=34485 RepID=A0ACC2TH56_9FUNG|nr:hypothetical protein DSO57_1012187 [Entomophthora muscae]